MFFYFSFSTNVISLLVLCGIVTTELHAEELGLTLTDINATNTESNKIDADWIGYSKCDPAFCLQACSANKTTDGFCDSTSSQQVCNCNKEKFSHAVLGNEGEWRVASMEVADDAVCIRYCDKISGYGRIWLKNASDGTVTKHCLCITGQISASGYTLCDRQNCHTSKCVEICKNPDATCVFTGACNCRGTWPSFFNLTEKNSRLETVDEKGECETKCKIYDYDWVSRVYDSDKPHPYGEPAEFRQKFCLCGEEVLARNLTIANKLREEGFQVCTGIKCKQRCQTAAAYCEPDHRRACYCNNQNIVIKKHLWSRLPTHEETMCQHSCGLAGLDPRVIEWNPLFFPMEQRFEPFYRKTQYQYLYDGKFCHCIKIEIRLNQFRPCTDELCEFFCGHHEATCDMKTRRACFCNTHKLMLSAGRLPESSERNCDLTCRANKMTGRIIDVTWKNQIIPDWGGAPTNKYCACIRPTTPSGLSHCEPENDQCPKMCQHPDSYCTKAKVCQCGEIHLCNKKNIRKGSLKEWDECAEKCRSWMWPLSVDMDNKAWIYDCGLENRTVKARKQSQKTKNETEVTASIKTTSDEDPTSFTYNESPGQVALAIEAMYSWTAPKKYCLCAKSTSTFHVPGFRGLASIEPARVPSNKFPCIHNHTCTLVNNALEISY